MLKGKPSRFWSFFQDHKELEKDFDLQRERPKEAQAEAKDKAELPLSKDNFFEEEKEKIREEVVVNNDKLLEA